MNRKPGTDSIARKAGIALAIFALAALQRAPEAVACGEVRVVEDVETLIAALEAGGAVRIPPGEYVLRGPLVVEQSVQIVMERGAVLVAAWSGGRSDAVLSLVPGSEGSELRGVRIDGGGNRLQGLRLQDVGDIRISDLSVSEVGEQGVWVQGSERVVIQDARLERTQTHEETSQSGAVRISGSTDVVIERAQVWDSGGKGIAFGNSSRCVVRDSTVHDTQRDAGCGIYFNNAHDNLVQGCHVIDPQGNALKISRRSSGIKVRDCTLNKERGVGTTLFIQGGLDSQVTGSRLISRLRRNTVQISEHPLENVGGPAQRNLILGNHIESAEGRFFGEAGEVSGNVYEGNLEVHSDDGELSDSSR